MPRLLLPALLLLLLLPRLHSAPPRPARPARLPRIIDTEGCPGCQLYIAGRCQTVSLNCLRSQIRPAG